MKRKIVHLLSDDEGEEDDELPDYSEEAANEIAHKSAYSRISEEAKWKANYAMQKMEKQKNQSDRFVAVSAEAVVSSRNSRKTNAINREESSLLFGDENNVVVKKKRRVTASVKETGVDTMSQYVKSMGSHELLPKESEILLGKQIQVLVKWENIRQELEEELSG
jgi:23S rRNA-/tRNA-specific pseudouridylate synthase